MKLLALPSEEFAKMSRSTAYNKQYLRVGEGGF
jgi:hypothetical protein